MRKTRRERELETALAGVLLTLGGDVPADYIVSPATLLRAREYEITTAERGKPYPKRTMFIEARPRKDREVRK